MVRFATLSCFGLAAAGDLGSQIGSHVRYGGDKLERQFTVYNQLPMGEAALAAAGWTKHDQNGCDPALGFAWTEDAQGPTKSKPLVLYTTAGGQPSGVGTILLGKGGQPLPDAQQQWATQDPLVPAQVDDAYAQVDVAFRSGDVLCSGAQEQESVGSKLIVNPKGTSKSIPLTEGGSEQEGWHRGSCFDGMGWHRFLDTASGSNGMSWKADNLFPVVAMYHENEVNAIFFASTTSQVDIPILKVNGWEPKALSNSEMCQNTCDGDCTFEGVRGSWSTMHIYFRDHKEVTCDQSLSCGLKWPFRGACCNAGVEV